MASALIPIILYAVLLLPNAIQTIHLTTGAHPPIQQIFHDDAASNSHFICDSTVPEIQLSENGQNASKSITFIATNPFKQIVCRMRIRAPDTHLISLQFIQPTVNEQRDIVFNNFKRTSCFMYIFLRDNSNNAVWRGDPCSLLTLPEVDLLTPDIDIVWYLPQSSDHEHANSNSIDKFQILRKFVVTAVGQGEFCKQPGQHTCMRIGWQPALCISDHLLCDGTVNCPKTPSTSDEDVTLCESRLVGHNSWEQLAVEIFRKFRPSITESTPTLDPIDIFNNLPSRNDKGKDGKHIVKQKSKTDSLSRTLSKYGPWGYLMLGMLICGTVLMFCGLWECCFRSAKTSVGVLNAVGTTHGEHDGSGTGGGAGTLPTTILIINEEQNNGTGRPQPPNYDDLDQPPSYTTLFPNFKPLLTMNWTAAVTATSTTTSISTAANTTLPLSDSTSIVAEATTSTTTTTTVPQE